MIEAMVETSPSKPEASDDVAARRRRLKHRNLIVLGLLIAWVALIYLVAIVRMGAQ